MEKTRELYKEKIRETLRAYPANYGETLRNRYSGYKHVCIWGAGNMGRALPQLLAEEGVKVDFYCDNDKSKIGMDVHGYGIYCISLDELMEIRDETAIIVPTRYYKAIYRQLESLGFPLIDRVFHMKFITDQYLKKHDKDKVIASLSSVVDILRDEESCRVLARLVEEWTRNEYKFGDIDDIYTVPQYFPKDFLDPMKDEIFVDCGAYIGDNIDDFLAFESNTFEKYYAFELNEKFYKKLVQNIQDKYSDFNGKFVAENLGVSDGTADVKYCDRGEGSRLGEMGNTSGKTVSIDDYFHGKKVTFIKMDIEGAEKKALSGAVSTIGKHLPRLAICIYHKPEDLWELPLYIKEHWPEYDIYIRHHTDLMTESVCYAVKRIER